MGRVPRRLPRSRPPGRSGGAGTGPRGPVNTGGVGKGTTHKSSSVEGTPMIGVVYTLAVAVVLVIGSVAAYLTHGYLS